VGLQLSQFSSPSTATFTVFAENTKLVVGAFHAQVFKDFKVVFPAPWTTLVSPLGLLNTCVAKAVATTFRITKYQATYWALSLKYTWRTFDEFTIITSKGFFLDIAVALFFFTECCQCG